MRVDVLGELGDAAESFRTAHDRVDGWWVRPLGAVPFIAQRLHAIEGVLGVDLDDGETQTALHLALLVRRSAGR